MERPKSLTVVAILNIVFGAIGLLCSPIGLVIYLLPQPALEADPAYALLRSEPLRTWTMASVAAGVIAAVVILAAGIGLLYLRPWARTLSLAYAVYATLFVIAGTLVQSRWMVVPLFEQARHGGSAPAAAGAVAGLLGMLTTSLLWLGHAGVLFWVLRRPAVVAALRRR